jgi:hypothetical protein
LKGAFKGLFKNNFFIIISLIIKKLLRNKVKYKIMLYKYKGKAIINFLKLPFSIFNILSIKINKIVIFFKFIYALIISV